MTDSQLNSGKTREKYMDQIHFQKNQNRDPTWPDFLDFEEFDLKNLKISLFEGTFLTKLYVGLYL